MAKGGTDRLDAAAVRAEVERATVAMEDVRRIKGQLTSAAGGIEEARKVLDGMAERVRGHLDQIDAMVGAAEGEDDAHVGAGDEDTRSGATDDPPVGTADFDAAARPPAGDDPF
jgi:hypothetical protein